MSRAAEQAWNARLQRALERTVWAAGGCSNWYRGPDGRITGSFTSPTEFTGFGVRFATRLLGDGALLRELEPTR